MNKIAFMIFATFVGGLGLVLLLGNNAARAQIGELVQRESSLADISSGFTYQGKLEQNNLPVNINCDFEFRLFDAASDGNQLGTVDSQSNVSVNNGLFTVTLNSANEFGATAFNGAERWLEIWVRCPTGSPGWTILAPRQPLTSAPYAATLRPGAVISGTVSGGVLSLSNNNGSGLYINSASIDGIDVIAAQDDGVVVRSAGDVGVIVNSAGSDGLYVNVAGGDGLFVCRTGSATACTPDPLSYNGVEIGHAQDNGVLINQADNGVMIKDAGNNGIEVIHANESGIQINAASSYGLHVVSASNDGVRVGSVVDDGLYVQSAGDDGVYVQSAMGNGAFVQSANEDGLLAWGDVHGVHGNVNAGSGEWGLYTDDKLFVGMSLTTNGLTLMAKVTGPDPVQAGDVAAAVGIANQHSANSAPLALVQLASESTFGNVIGVVEGRMVQTAHPGSQDFYDWRGTSGPAHEGDYVALTVLGVAEVKVESGAAIQPGQRLTASNVAGAVRPLRMSTVNGIVVSEGGPVIGIALAAPEPGIDTIPVFVTLR